VVRERQALAKPPEPVEAQGMTLEATRQTASLSRAQLNRPDDVVAAWETLERERMGFSPEQSAAPF
jgi:hypothetical protein